MSRSDAPGPTTTFVVSGGGRGITARCVVALAQRFGCSFVLLGRTPIDTPEPTWALACADPAELRRSALNAFAHQGPAAVEQAVTRVLRQREVEATLREVVAAGGQADYLTVDVADRAALLPALSGASIRPGGEIGLIHAAGALADRPIDRKTAADFETVYRPKVDGLANLLEAMPVETLRWLVLFSSAAGFYGNPGQADYALANEVLNKFAYLVRRNHPACGVVAMNWAPWDAGMVTPTLRAVFAERGIATIPIDVGPSALTDELATGAHSTQVLVGSPMLDQRRASGTAVNSFVNRVHRRLTREANPFLADHVLDGHPVLPAAAGGAWLADTCAGLYPGYTFVRWRDYRVYHGLVFDAGLPSDLVTEVRQLEPASDELRLEARVWSENQRGRPRYHYGAEIVLAQRPPDPPSQPLPRPTLDAFDGAALYHDGTLFHGPRYRGLRRVLRLDNEGIALECLLAGVPERDQGQFPAQTVNHFAADVAFQALVIWGRRKVGAASLPLRSAAGESFASIPFDRPFFVTADVRTVDDTSVTADLVIQAEDGRVCMRLAGAQVTLSRHLNALFAQAGTR